MKHIGLTLALALAIPATADAAVYDIHLGGICSTGWEGGKGGGYLGYWAGETPVNAYVDQQNSMSTATTQFAQTLDTYCTNGNVCYIYTYSNGGAVLSRTLSIYETGRWAIGY